MIAESLLQANLDFHKETSTYASHALHAFAAKFPPQLPRTFIENLTLPGETVLDPMNGSGTTTLEAYMLKRQGIGIDIDPLAIKIAKVKSTPIDLDGERLADEIGISALTLLKNNPSLLDDALANRFDEKTKEFINYWFFTETQREIMALILSIERFDLNHPVREFLEVLLSSIIVTKSGGVTRARDLAHSRPHLDRKKTPRSAIEMFIARLRKFAPAIRQLPNHRPQPVIKRGDAKKLDLPAESVHLVVTSPPYANAIDYMRAHKFSLVWFGQPIAELSTLRSRYIGSEATNGFQKNTFPSFTEQILGVLSSADPKKEAILRKYFSEMRDTMREMYRVLVPGRCAVLIVGTSTMRGIDVKTPYCLADIAEKDLGFRLIGIKSRNLERDKRLMPASNKQNKTKIEQRMHTEEVIILEKPRS